MNDQELLKDILSSLITAFVSIIAMITSYKAARNSTKQSYSNNIDNMQFVQKEKVADQVAEKSAILLTKCDPNVLNTIINEIVPRDISHEENANIRKYLLSITDDIQTYSNIIKMLSYSIYDSEEIFEKMKKVWNEMDTVYKVCSDMILQLVEIYTSMTPEGRIKGISIMEEKLKLERTFSENYSEIYIQLYESISDLIWNIRQESIPKVRTENKHKKKVKKSQIRSKKK